MRDRRPILHLAGLLLVLVATVLSPISAMATSGLPPTIMMEPGAAGPGSVVEVSGIDFPAGQLIEVQLEREAGRSDLALLISSDEGYFRTLVEFPNDVTAGRWELRATALDGSSASHTFQAVSAEAVAAEAASRASTEAGLSIRRGNSGTDIMVMLILSLLLAAVGGGVAYAWREVHGQRTQPGMGAAADPIWSLAGSDDTGPELILTQDPDMGAHRGES